MSKTDIFGKKPYREIQVKSAKPDLLHRYVLAVRTDADSLSFSKTIFTETNYLFYISQNRFHTEELNKFSEFQSFIHEDNISDNKIFYLQNVGFESGKHILGYEDNSLFQIKGKNKKRKNQLSLLLEEEDADLMDFIQENDIDEIQNWHNLKADLSKKSVNIMGKIDYVFPIRIETYEIVKPLLQHFPKMQAFNYMLLEPKQIHDAASFFMYMDLITEQIHSADKMPLRWK